MAGCCISAAADGSGMGMDGSCGSSPPLGESLASSMVEGDVGMGMGMGMDERGGSCSGELGGWPRWCLAGCTAPSASVGCYSPSWC